jgi:hypothetical protein
MFTTTNMKTDEFIWEGGRGKEGGTAIPSRTQLASERGGREAHQRRTHPIPKHQY